MRKDMFKVIVERPRGGAMRHRGWRVVPDGNLPQTGPLRPHRGRTKWLNENLAPLERFFERRVGRYWPKVFAEVCEHISVGSTVQKHVRDHVEDIVAVKAARRDDGIWIAGRRTGGPVPLSDLYWLRFYVHPVSQVLMRNPHWRRSRGGWRASQDAYAADLAKRYRAAGAYRALHKIDGIWYELRLAPVPHGRDAAAFDRWRSGWRNGEALAAVTRDELSARMPGYAIAKRQLAARELAAANLANDARD
ncbi:MAG: hypothetical protein U1F37_17255 [Alphaproteobacteria bacterium]